MVPIEAQLKHMCVCECVARRKQLKGTAWLSAVSSQSGRDTRGARVYTEVGIRFQGVVLVRQIGEKPSLALRVCNGNRLQKVTCYPR